MAEGGVGVGGGWGAQGDRVVGFYFCFVAALLTRSSLKFNLAESVCVLAGLGMLHCSCTLTLWSV